MKLVAENGQEYPLSEPKISIGRGEDSSFQISDPRISSQHAIIEQLDNRFTLSDAKSTNGTFINDNRLTKPQALRSGDVISLGGFKLTFHSDNPAVDATMINQNLQLPKPKGWSVPNPLDQSQRTSVLAIVSLIAGLSIVVGLPIIGAPIALVTGYSAKREIKASQGILNGDILASIGIIFGWIGLILMLCGVGLIVVGILPSGSVIAGICVALARILGALAGFMG